MLTYTRVTVQECSCSSCKCLHTVTGTCLTATIVTQGLFWVQDSHLGHNTLLDTTLLLCADPTRIMNVGMHCRGRQRHKFKSDDYNCLVQAEVHVTSLSTQKLESLTKLSTFSPDPAFHLKKLAVSLLQGMPLGEGQGTGLLGLCNLRLLLVGNSAQPGGAL